MAIFAQVIKKTFVSAALFTFPKLLAVETSALTPAGESKGVGAYAGAGFIPRPAVSVGAFVKLSDSLFAETEFASGNFELKIADQNTKSTRSHITARTRYFLGNSFNLNLGLAYDILTDESNYNETGLDATSTTNATRVELKTSVHQLEVEAGIGNRWDLGGFVLGCDWFGVGVPVAQLNTSTTANAGAKSLNKVKDFEKDTKKHSKSVSIHFLKVNAGYQF